MLQGPWFAHYTYVTWQLHIILDFCVLVNVYINHMTGDKIFGMNKGTP